jgi:carbamoyl-phosphate synthase large subunit
MKVLISSASRKAPLIRAAKDAAARIDPQAKVIAGDADATALSRYVADAFWQMPPTTDANAEAVLAGCRARGISVVLPTRDGELVFWARRREAFAAEGIRVIVSSLQSVERCLDKLAFAQFGAAQGLPVIPAALSPEGPGPYVVKERFGAGSRAIGLNLGRDEALAHAAKLSAPIYQPYVTGREISIDAWLDAHRRVKGVVLRRRDVVVNGESHVTTTFRDPVIEAAAIRILEALGLEGPVVLQALVDESGAMKVIECNSRFGGASTAAIAAGLDSLHWSFAGGRELPAFVRRPGEVRQVRLASDVIIHDPDL